MRAYFTPQAEIDLEEVGDYIALDNPRRAISFIREIVAPAVCVHLLTLTF
jgi:toxin ParE1/3/4